MRMPNRLISSVLLLALVVALVAWKLDAQSATNPGVDARARYELTGKMATDASNADAAAARINLDVPSNADSIASLAAHAESNAQHGCGQIASLGANTFVEKQTLVSSGTGGSSWCAYTTGTIQSAGVATLAQVIHAAGIIIITDATNAKSAKFWYHDTTTVVEEQDPETWFDVVKGASPSVNFYIQNGYFCVENSRSSALGCRVMVLSSGY